MLNYLIMLSLIEDLVVEVRCVSYETVKIVSQTKISNICSSDSQAYIPGIIFQVIAVFCYFVINPE